MLVDGRHHPVQLLTQQQRGRVESLVQERLKASDKRARLTMGWALSLYPNSATVLAALRRGLVVDPDRGRLQPLRQAGGQILGDLLVDASFEAILGPVAEDAQGVVGDGGAVAELTGVVGLDQVEGLTPGAAGQLPQKRRVG